MPENELIVPQDQLPQQADDKMFDLVAGSVFMPRIQFMSSQSEQCKDGSFPINHYALFKSKTPSDLGAEINVLVIAWRPKAMRVGDGVMTFFKTDNPEFQKVMEESKIADSGCMFGPEFLCFLPGLNEYVTFFLGSKSARNESPNMKQLVGKRATLRGQKLSNKKFTWQSPQIVECTVPFDVPEMEDIKTVATKFLNPPESEVETIEEGADEKRAR